MIQNFDVFKDAANNCYQLRSKSLSYALEFDTEEKEALFLNIVAAIQNKPDSSLKELKQKISHKDNEAVAIDVLHSLNEYSLLPFELSAELGGAPAAPEYANRHKRPEDAVLAITGEGEHADYLLEAAKKQPFKAVQLVPYSALPSGESIEQLVLSADFLLVDGNEWSPYHNELINSYCLRHNKPWLYTAGVEEISIKIGPLFFGSETGCYNCLSGRIKSNHEYPHYLQGYESYLRDKKIAARPDRIPDRGVIYTLAANMALLEVMKFMEEWCLPVTWRTMLSFNMMNLQLTKHPLLKKPFCEVCKPHLEYNPSPWLEAVTLK